LCFFVALAMISLCRIALQVLSKGWDRIATGRNHKGEPCCYFFCRFSLKMTYTHERLGTALGQVKRIMKHLRMLVLIAVVLCILALPVLFGDSTTLSMAVDVLLLTGAAVAWNIFSGYTGYISLGNATYYGIGAYVLALAYQDWHIPAGYGPFLLLPLAGLVAGAFSVPLGWIALRTRRYTFMVITIAIFFIFQSLAYNLRGLTGGSEGVFLPVPDWSSDLFNLPFYFVAVAFVLLVTLVSWWIRHSKYGLALLAIRDDEDRVRGLGVPTGWYKLGAYVLSAALTGIVGAIAIYFVGFITPTSAFDQGFDLTIVTISFLGGIGTLIGPLVGGLLFVPVQTFLVQQFGVLSTGFVQILFGGILLVVILFLPEGIVPSLQKRWQMWKASRTKLQTQVVRTQSPSFAAISINTSEHYDFVKLKGVKGEAVPTNQSSNKISWNIPPIPDHHSVLLYPSMNISPRVKAQRLVPLSSHESVAKQVQIATPPAVSWRCPSCRRPMLLKSGICYCPRCGFMRSLTESIS
jgi:branched-chain amino acid transport system permease protein